MKDTQEERRRYKRIPFFKEIRIMGVGSFPCLNISAGGICLAELPPAVPQPFEVEIDLEEGQKNPVAVRAYIHSKRSTGGVGLIFNNIKPTDLQKIERYVEQS